jgi:HEPN domain-containing protein
MTKQLLIDKWKELARDDLKLCEIALRESLFLQAAFHAQQSIEKTKSTNNFTQKY